MQIVTNKGAHLSFGKNHCPGKSSIILTTLRDSAKNELLWISISMFFYKESLYKEPTYRRQKKFKELVLLKKKSLRNFSISNIVMTANN